jgi:hypothetical protein
MAPHLTWIAFGVALVIIALVVFFVRSRITGNYLRDRVDDDVKETYSPQGAQRAAVGRVTANMANRTIDTKFIERIVLLAGEALRRNEYKRLEDNEQVSLTLYLMMAFGYDIGGRLTPKKLAGLLKTVEFAKLCVASDWIDSSLTIIRPIEATRAFKSLFSDAELHAFDYLSLTSSVPTAVDFPAPYSASDPDDAAALNLEYIRAKHAWEQLSWWKRLRTKRPTPPAGI